MENVTTADEQEAVNTTRSSRKENRKIITPYAFEVPEFLYGTALASPVRRGSAMLLDLLLVALLAGVSGHALSFLIACLVLIAAYRMKKRQKNPRTVTFLTVFAMFMIVITILDLSLNTDYNNTQNYTNSSKQSSSSEDTSTKFALALFTGKYLMAIANIEQRLQAKECETLFLCWQDVSDNLVKDILDIGVTEEQAKVLLTKFKELAQEDISTAESEILYERMWQQLEGNFKAAPVIIADTQLIEQANNDELWPANPTQQTSSDYSIINWVKGIAADLGLGFGWAAFYFTAFTGLFNGQTPGKKVFGIKIIKLDGSKLNLWESFGRYGGYGAGLATGLLGFLQIFWDANRQAIQDKISETMVINTRKPKQPYHP